MNEFQPVITAIGAGILYSLVWYANKSIDPTNPQQWKDIDPWPLLATALTGACIGIISIMKGVELTQVSFEVQILAYGALTAVIERCGKTIRNVIKIKWGI